MKSLETVQAIYQAFGRGDVAAILQHLAEDVEWEYPPTSTSAPWLQHRVGRDAVPGFFQSLAGLTMERFEPREFLGNERTVVVLLDVEFTVRSTGRKVVEIDEIHVWRFNERGQVVRFKHGVDSHLHHLVSGGH